MEYKKKRDAGLRANLKPSMTFTEAAAEWVRALSFGASGEKWEPRPMGFVSVRTLADYKTVLLPLSKHFAHKRLHEIDLSDVQNYQQARAEGTYTDQSRPKGTRHGVGAGANLINKEVSLLLRFLRYSKAWAAPTFELYIPLQPQKFDVQRALTVEEQARFLRTAASSEKWGAVYWFSMLALNTTMRTCELRVLQVGDFDLKNAVVSVRREGAKNQGSIRTIPLNRDALKSAEAILERAKQRGSYQSSHYVFAFQECRDRFDPNRPMSESGIKRHWIEVRAASGVPWFRMYDLRHTAITRLAEAGTPIPVIMEFAGHIDAKMQQRYTHISMQAKRRAATLSLLETEANSNSNSKTTLREKLVSAAAAADSKLGAAANALTIPNLIKRLQRAGLPSDVILGILADTDGASEGGAQ